MAIPLIEYLTGKSQVDPATLPSSPSPVPTTTLAPSSKEGLQPLNDYLVAQVPPQPVGSPPVSPSAPLDAAPRTLATSKPAIIRGPDDAATAISTGKTVLGAASLASKASDALLNTTSKADIAPSLGYAGTALDLANLGRVIASDTATTGQKVGAGAKTALSLGATYASSVPALSGASSALGSLASAAPYVVGAYDISQILGNDKMESDEKAFETVFQAGKMAANYFLPVVGGIAADLVHEYISKPIAELFGGFGPSKDWLSFPGRVGETLSLTSEANNQLGLSLSQAKSDDEISAAIAMWKGSVATRVGGFGEGSGAFDIPDVPGAGGSKHEGGISANFVPQIAGLRAMADAARRGLSMEERSRAYFTASVNAMTPIEKIQADPQARLLTPAEQEQWGASLMSQTGESFPDIAKALRDGALSPLHAQGVLDALSPGTTSFVAPPPPELLAKYKRPDAVVYAGGSDGGGGGGGDGGGGVGDGGGDGGGAGGGGGGDG